LIEISLRQPPCSIGRAVFCSAVPPEIGVRQEQVISRFKAISEVAGAMEKARRFTSMNGLFDADGWLVEAIGAGAA
jgi:hypothetical protein